jgi:hypothetical protein
MSNRGIRNSDATNWTRAVIPNNGRMLPNWAITKPPRAALPLQLNMLMDSTADHLPRWWEGTWSIKTLRVNALVEFMKPLRTTYKRHVTNRGACHH